MFYPEDTSGNRKKLASTFNKAGALKKLQLASTEWVSHIAYNAKGQRIMSVNASLFTRFVYDDKTFNVARIRASKFNKSGNTYTPISGIRLDRGYTHDLMGSVVEIHDITPKNQWAQGPGNLTRQFTHDPLRRLISATGREATGAIPTAPWRLDTQPEDHTATNTYTRNYAYDKQGNILELQHIANGHSANNFTRTFNYDNGFATNKLNDFTVGSNTFSYNYDANGNIIKENSERYFEWNFADKLAFFKRQAGTGNPSVWVHYLYDNNGNRIKKIVNKAGSIQEVTVYIDGIYEYSYTKNSGTIDTNRNYNTLHITDPSSGSGQAGNTRVGTQRTGSDADDSIPAQKYFVEDHLGNCSVAVKTDGARLNMEEPRVIHSKELCIAKGSREAHPFGQTSFGSYAKKRYRYNGKEKDSESDLYYYRARYYAPWLCRFISCDPMKEERAWLTPYNYVQNNPINLTDPTGALDDGGGDPVKKGDTFVGDDGKTNTASVDEVEVTAVAPETLIKNVYIQAFFS
ncbi:MAG: RHS repeat-associated core domain-containing protein [Cryomorphaceae bacterium]